MELNLSPEELLIRLASGKLVTQALKVAAELQIADHLKSGPKDVKTLAIAAGASADGLYRLLRCLAAMGVFTELEGKRFRNNEVSELLRSDRERSYRAQVRWLGHTNAWKAWDQLEFSVRTGKPAWNEVFGMNLFAFL